MTQHKPQAETATRLLDGQFPREARQQATVQDDEFGRWLALQSEVFRGKRPVAQAALLNPALLHP